MNILRELQFLDSDALWALPLVLLLCLVLFVFRKVKISRLAILGIPAKLAQKLASHLAIWGACLILVLLLVSTARPYLGSETLTLPARGRDIMAVLDVSRSMLTKDVSPSRIEFSKRKLKDLVSVVAKTTPGDRVGLTLFAGDSYLYCPFTSDYSVLKVFIDSISTDLITAQGSLLEDALTLVAENIKLSASGVPQVILLSDGEDMTFNLESSLEMLKKSGDIHIDALGIGTPQGMPIETEQGRYLKDRAGNIVVSKLNEDSLRRLTEGSGGLYQKAWIDDSDVMKLLARSHQVTTRLEKDSEQTITIYHEIGPYLLWGVVAIVLGFLAAGKREILFIVALSLGVVSTAPRASAQDKDVSQSVLHSAWQDYNEGRYEQALKGFSDALSVDPNNPALIQALASVHYKMGHFEDARSLFDRLEKLSTMGRQSFQADYNRGNSEFMLKKYDDAIKSYEDALKLKPGDADAMFNLEAARKMKQQQQQEQEDKKKEDQKKDPQDQQNQKDEKDERDKSNKPDQENSDKKEQSEPKEDGEKPDSKEQQQEPQEQGTPTPDPSKAEKGGAEPTPATEEHLNNEGQEGQTEKPLTLKEEEAKAWLDSLSDSPVLLQRKVGPSPNPRGQTW